MGSPAGGTGISWRRVVTVVAMVAFLVVGAGCQLPDPGGPFPGPPRLPVIGCDQAAQRVEVSQSARLDPSCTYTAGIDVVASDVTLDCAGAHIVAAAGVGGVGIELTSPATVALHDVDVRNCSISGFTDNLRVTRQGFKTLAAGSEYAVQDARIVIEHDQLSDADGTGAYVDAYVTGVTLRDLDISGAGGAGIYLEAGSTGTTVVGNTIHGNGFAGTGPDGTTTIVGGKPFHYLGSGREGIAIDGSRDNHIEGNQIVGNAAGGIFLYENCGEDVHQAGWWPRRYGADDNVIAGNVIAGSPFGVWVGSRMAENLAFMDCSDPPYVSKPFVRIIEDHATGTTISANQFRDDTWGVRIEDDDTTVRANQFVGTVSSGAAVAIGTKYRTATLSHPVTSTSVVGNSVHVAGMIDPFRWDDGQTGTTFLANRATPGTAAVLAQAPLPPNNPFFMVVRFLPA